MRLFKRKKKEEKKPAIDFEKYKLVFNVKSICYYELMTNKSFFEMSTEEDMLHLLHAMLIINNDVYLTFDAFLAFIEDERVMRWFMSKVEDIRRKSTEMLHNENTDGKEPQHMKVSDIAALLIIKYKMDAEYVNYKMDLWELKYYITATQNLLKEEYEYDRLWTFFEVIPHVDSKKIKGPEDLIKFPWEDDKKDKEFEKNKDAAMSFLLNNNKKETDNGEGRPDNSTEREGVSGSTEEIINP